MNKIIIILFFFIFYPSFNSFAQVVEEIVQLDTISETLKVIYRPTIRTTYYFKKVAVFADDTSQVAIEKSFTSYGQNGLYKVYYPNGRLKVKTVFANNKINGEWTWYDTKGIILVKGVYKAGIKHGYWAYKSLKIYGRYKKGLKNRRWKRFDKNEKKYVSRYKKGVLIKGEGFGNEKIQTTAKNDSIVSQKDTIITNNTLQPDKEYQQAISFLTENVVFRKTMKKYFGTSIKKTQQLKRYFKNNQFLFVISPSLMPLSISTFIKESKENKIVVTKIDSLLKNNNKSLELAFAKEVTEKQKMLYENSTNILSPMAVYFSEIHQNLLRIDVVRYNSTIGKDNFVSRYKPIKKEQKFEILLYFDDKGTLKAAEYQKPLP